MIVSGVVATLFVVVACAWALLRRRRRADLFEEMARTISIRGTEATLPEAVWAFSAMGGAQHVLDVIDASSTRSSTQLREEIDAMILELPKPEGDRLAAHITARRAAVREKTVWTSHSDYVAAAAALGGTDSLIMAGGDLGLDHLDLGASVEAVDVLTHGLVAGVLNFPKVPSVSPGLEHFAPELAQKMQDSLADMFEPLAEIMLESGADAADLLLNVADSGIPIATTFLSIKKAVQSSNAGLDGSRVGENLAWDLGARGGGIAAGAAIGTAIFPVVGTVVGGLLGGLFGGEVAAEGKSRHYRAARSAADEALEALGSSISPRKWAAQTESLKAVVTAEKAQLDILEAHDQRDGWWPRPGPVLLRSVISIGESDHLLRRKDLAEWQRAVHETAAPGQEIHRAVMVMTRPGLQHTLGTDNRLAKRVDTAYAHLAAEEEKLKLS